MMSKMEGELRQTGKVRTTHSESPRSSMPCPGSPDPIHFLSILLEARHTSEKHRRAWDWQQGAGFRSSYFGNLFYAFKWREHYPPVTQLEVREPRVEDENDSLMESHTMPV